MRSLASRCVVFCFLILGLCLSAPVQGQIPMTNTALTAMSLSDDGGALTLTFSTQAPRFSVVADGTDKPSVILALTSADPALEPLKTQRGDLRSVAFSQSGSILTLQLAGARPISVTVMRASNRLVLHLAGSGPSNSPGAPTDAAAPAGLPAQTFREPDQDGFEVVRLNYADVSEVVGLLTEGQSIKANNSFTPKEPAFGSVALGGTATGPVQPSVIGPSDDPLAQSVNDTIAVDRRLNAIILNGNPERIAQLKKKIREVDVPVETVLLETMFVELDKNGAKDAGIDFNNSSGQIGVATLTTGAFTPTGFDANKPFASASVQAAIYAQVERGRGRVVSKPRISALSGSTAKIITGDALPILTSIALSGVNGVSQQVQYVNVGVTLQIAPRVTLDGFVNSQIYCMVSGVTSYTSNGYPRISQREAQTSATVHDGETYVIGGLTEDNSSETKSKVPLLGDIPGLDHVLGYTHQTETKTDLYIVVTPHIVRRGEELPADVLKVLRGSRTP